MSSPVGKLDTQRAWLFDALSQVARKKKRNIAIRIISVVESAKRKPVLLEKGRGRIILGRDAYHHRAHFLVARPAQCLTQELAPNTPPPQVCRHDEVMNPRNMLVQIERRVNEPAHPGI